MSEQHEHASARPSRPRRATPMLAAGVAAIVAVGVGFQAVAGLITGDDEVGDVTQLGGRAAPVDISGVEVDHGADEVTVTTTIVNGPGELGQVDTMIDTDGDADPEFVQRYRSPTSVTETATTTWEDDFYGPVTCPLETRLQRAGDRLVLTATTARSCLGDPRQVRVWTWAAGTAPDSTWRDASAGSPPVERWEFTWSTPVASADAVPDPTDPSDPTDPPSDPTTDPTTDPGPAATTTQLRIPRPVVAAGRAVRARIVLRSEAGSPRGVVTLRHRRLVLKQVVVRGGAQRVRLTGLRPGRYRVRAVYGGDEAFRASRSRTVRVVVRRR